MSHLSGIHYRRVRLDPNVAGVAEAIHRVQQAAYRVEAELLGVTRFAPLDQTVAEIRASGALYYGNHANNELVGVLACELGAGDAPCNIDALVVMPEWHRRGIATHLLMHLEWKHPGRAFTVSTGIRNAPALALYRGWGFVEYAREIKGADPIEIVRLRRLPKSLPRIPLDHGPENEFDEEDNRRD
jgi:ribosomal protein S18 acetylase RimI-like enzyme